MLSLKPGVIFDEVRLPIVEVLPTLVLIYRSYGRACVITSARDGRHMEGSKHYTGEAIDLRTYFFTPAQRKDVHRDVQNALGPDYDVILERDHIHIEFDPE